MLDGLPNAVGPEQRVRLAKMVCRLFEHWGLDIASQLALLGLSSNSQTRIDLYGEDAALPTSGTCWNASATCLVCTSACDCSFRTTANWRTGCPQHPTARSMTARPSRSWSSRAFRGSWPSAATWTTFDLSEGSVRVGLDAASGLIHPAHSTSACEWARNLASRALGDLASRGRAQLLEIIRWQ